ncbi:LOW QUALITY PROTEIN: hypothetical protein PHAVU_005G132900 [Phaseolus vulgaris]
MITYGLHTDENPYVKPSWMAIDLYIREVESLIFQVSMNQCSDRIKKIGYEAGTFGDSTYDVESINVEKKNFIDEMNMKKKFPMKMNTITRVLRGISSVNNHHYIPRQDFNNNHGVHKIGIHGSD